MQQRANKLRRGTLQGVFSRVQLVRVVHPIIRAYHWWAVSQKPKLIPHIDVQGNLRNTSLYFSTEGKRM